MAQNKYFNMQAGAIRCTQGVLDSESSERRNVLPSFGITSSWMVCSTYCSPLMK